MRMVQALRIPEAFIVAGFTFIGAFLAVPSMGILLSVREMLFLTASYLVIVSIYAFNSWAGFAEDRANPRLALSVTLPRRFFACVSVLTGGVAVLLFIPTAPQALPYALLVWLLWSIYSFPRRGAKYLPVAGTVVHLFVGVVQFHQGWVWHAAPSSSSLLLSLSFALLLAAGHINHEMIDYEADRQAGIMSGAVRFGLRCWAWLHALVSGGAFFLFLALSTFCAAEMPSRLFPFLIASLGHCWSAVRLACEGSFSPLSFLRHRVRYRLLYGTAGLISLIMVWHG